MNKKELIREQLKYKNRRSILRGLLIDIENDDLPQSLNDDSKENFMAFTESLIELCKRCSDLIESSIDDLEND